MLLRKASLLPFVDDVRQDVQVLEITIIAVLFNRHHTRICK
jgi:hypothetical protein